MKAILTCLAALAAAMWAGPARAEVRVGESASAVAIENDLVQVRYDLSAGTCRAVDKRAGTPLLEDAFTQIDQYCSNAAGLRRTWTQHEVLDALALARGRVLAVRCEQAGAAALLLEITLYEDRPAIVLWAGLENLGGRDVRIKEIHPLRGGRLFPQVSFSPGGSGIKAQQCRTLNGISGAGRTQVLDGFIRQSPNNVLLTFQAGRERRSVVLGGLTYHEFAKYVSVGQSDSGGSAVTRRGSRAQGSPPGASLAAYCDCGEGAAPSAADKAVIRVLAGKPHKWGNWGETAAADDSALFDDREVAFQADGLDPAKQYVLGWAWWDYNADGRVETVSVAPADKPAEAAILLEKAALPDWAKHRRMPEDRFAAVPKSAYAGGKLRIAFANQSKAPNAVVGEVWLWEAPADAAITLPAQANQPAAASVTTGLAFDVCASDPVGKRVDAGKSFLGDERFYLDLVTSCPFQSLEQYGLAVKAAQNVRINIYTFPTLCAWYVEAFQQGPKVNNTAGLVEEMGHVRKSGFLKYAPVGLRLVPDKYLDDSEQGWWDDQHWQKWGHYVKPYETSEKWCRALRDGGCLPFTYVQTGMPSDDYAKAFPGHILFNDISKLSLKHPHHQPYVTFDYTDADFQVHMKKVWSDLGRAGLKGVMFDYPETGWRSEEGGFDDVNATTASAYRRIFELCREGLGPDACIHERNLGESNRPLLDVTAGLVDSQRVWGDTNLLVPEMIARCGLRWYKNRVLYTYDLDSKTLFDRSVKPPRVIDAMRRRSLLTLWYMVAGRVLLADSFRELTPDMVHDLSRIFPVHETTKSARPVDAFTGTTWPGVYDFEVEPGWRQVILYNGQPKEAAIGTGLSGEVAAGNLGLDPKAAYYVYDFWADRLVGKLAGTDRLEMRLQPSQAVMLSVRAVLDRPQVLSTNRHVMQGYVDMSDLKWDAGGKRLSGRSKVIGGETYRVVLAANGWAASSARAGDGAKAEMRALDAGLAELRLDAAENAAVGWAIEFEK